MTSVLRYVILKIIIQKGAIDMEKEITGVYQMITYSDGSIVFKRLEEKLEDYEIEGVSERIKQIVGVIKFVNQMHLKYPNSNFLDIERYTTEAMKSVAKTYGVSVSTVQDKCTRQSGLSKSEFSLNLLDVFKNNKKEGFALDNEPLYKAIISKTNDKADIQYLRKALTILLNLKGE